MKTEIIIGQQVPAEVRVHTVDSRLSRIGAELPYHAVLSLDDLTRNADFLRPALVGRPLGEQIALIEDWYRPQIEATGIVRHCQGETDALAPEIVERAQRQRDGAARYETLLNQKGLQTQISTITARLHSADRATDERIGHLDYEARASARLASGKWQVVSDLDNTLTDHSLLTFVTKGVDPTLLGSGLADPLNAPNRTNFLELYAAIWLPLLHAFPEVFTAGGMEAPLREGADVLFDYLQALGIPTSILSTNFEPYPRAVVERFTTQSNEWTVAFHTVNTHEDHGAVAVRKDMVLQAIAATGEQPIVYLGDGSTDYPAVSEDARKVIAVYFALEGSVFHHQLLEEQKKHPEIIFFTYSTAHDIQEKLAKLVDPTIKLMNTDTNNPLRRDTSYQTVA